MSDNNVRFKLGRKPAIIDQRTLRFSDYIKTLLPPPPSVDYTKGLTSFGVAGNDVLGDCCIAGCDHAVQIWSANTGIERTIPDQVVENYYGYWCGYVPGQPETDAGCAEMYVLNHWRKHGFNGHKLTAYIDPAVNDFNEIKQAIHLFGLVYIGFNVPQSIMDSANDPTVVWDVGGDETIVGGHCVILPKYDAELLTCVSWGSLYRMTPAFFAKYVDEVHCLLSPDWFNWSTRLSASGFKFGQLWADLAAL